MSKKQKTFESSLEQLESIVTKLEDGELSLEESLSLFEDGVKLSRECQERLTEAERRIEILVKDKNGNLQTEDYETADIETEKPKVKKRIVFSDDDEDGIPF